jgi:hypothetical protein
MAINNFRPDVWSATLLSVLYKNLVFAGAQVANRDYEGEITDFGSTVKITSVTAPTITAYTKNTDLTAVETLTDAGQTLAIDQSYAFNFQIDDIDLRQSRSGGALMTQAAEQAAYKLTDVADQYVAAKMALQATNTLGVIDASTIATNVYDQLLVPASVKLNQANVPMASRFIIVDPATYGKLQLDLRFVAAYASGTDALHNGIVGNAAGFVVLQSNNAFQSNRAVTTITTVSGATSLTGVAGQFNQGDIGLSVAGTGIGASAKITAVSADGSVATVSVNSTASAAVTVTLSGGGQLAYAGSTIGITYAEQINKVEAYRPQARFGDALKGLHLYGAKVVHPEALVVASVKVS